MKEVLLFFVTCLLWRKTLGIYGGCMSFSSSHTNLPGQLKVEIFFLNGWKLQQGPCYNCTETDEGSDVTARRKQYIFDKNNPTAFGSWSFEVELKGTESTKSQNLTIDVNNNIKDIVLMVNKHEGWELESSEINLIVNMSNAKGRRFDIMFENVNDGELTDMRRGIDVFLQVKVDPCNRTDTKKPNNSPVVLIKPYYSLEHGKTHTINIPAIDNDDDLMECEFSNFVEAGNFGHMVRNLTDARILTINNTACVLTINLKNTRFSVGDTFAIPVTVKDYSKKDIVSATSYSAYSTPIGRVTALMFFKITGKTDPPKFISPTPPNNQEYTVYIGGDFHVSVYAKPTDNTRRINKFNFLRRDGIHVQQTPMVSVPGDINAVCISMTWSPVNSDIGKHIVCANAEDSDGISTVELHCFRIDVKENIIRPNPSLPGKPYFASFPIQQDIICPVGSYCRFPIYATTDNTGGIERIESTATSIENVTIQYSSDIINGTINTKVAQVQFLALTPGPRQICLNATDRVAWTVRCLIVTVQRQDPCELKPCKNKGRCTAFKDRSGFTCTCGAKNEGPTCERAIKYCNKTTCNGSNDCVEMPIFPYFVCLKCPVGKTGTRCDVDIDVCHPSPCSENNICEQDQRFHKCIPGVVQQRCSCFNTATSVCVKNQCYCSLGHKPNGTCTLDETFKSSKSHKPHFIPPTPAMGSVITCNFNQQKCHFPVYLLSETTPRLSFFNDINLLGINDRKISFLPLVSNMDGVYQTTTLLSKPNDPDPKYKEFDLCLIVAKLESPNEMTDRRCFHVVDKGIPSGNQTMSQVYPHCSFAQPTLPRESTIGCRKGESCHFFLYAETLNGICQDLITNDLSTGILSPVIYSRLCRYEAVYTNTTLVGVNTICFMICAKGESRCFQMYTNDINDQCTSNPCLNNAHCQTESSGNFRCHCREGFWGAHCENGFCNSQSYCQNNAVCFTRNGNHSCLCRRGFEGSTCALKIKQNLSDIIENGGHFNQPGLIETLTCYLSSPCTVPISITRNIHSMPTLEVGFRDKTLEVQSLLLEPSANIGGIVRGTLTVVGHELGQKMICLDFVAYPKTAKIEDEICFRINIIPGHALEQLETNPFFINPTLPNATVLQCVVNKQCYVSLWAKNKVGVEKCPSLEVDKTIEDGVYIFPRDTTHQPCVYDSVISIGNVTDVQVCFYLQFDASSQQAIQAQHDNRCYIVRFGPKLTAKGSCAGISCYNDGFCDGSSPSSQCLCRSGFSNHDCSHGVGVAQGNKSDTNLWPNFGDLALPKLVRCPLSENCVLPFSVTKTSSFNSSYVGWNGTNINSVIISLAQIPGSGDLSGNAVVIHTATGKDKFCLTLTMSDYVYDRVCCFILTEPAVVHQQLDNGQGLFISPSPTNNSEFSCTPGKPCHVTFRTSKGNDQKCPELQDRSTLPVHIFTALSPNECQRDMLIESKNSTQGKEKYCFQTSSSGILGEVRCMTIHFENHVLPPPPLTTTTTTTTTTTSTTTESPTNVIPSTTTTTESPTNVIPSTTTTTESPTTVISSTRTITSESPTNVIPSTITTESPTNVIPSTTTTTESPTNVIPSTTTTESPTNVIPSTTTTPSATSDNDLTTSNTLSASLPGNGPETTTNKEISTRQTEQLASKETTLILGSGQTKTTLGTAKTTRIKSEQTIIALETGQQTATLVTGGTTTTLASRQATTKFAAGQTTITFAAGQTTSTLSSAQTTSTLAAEQTRTLATGQTTTTFVAGQTTTLATGQTTTTTFATGKTITSMQHKSETCDVVDVQERAKKGRVECECFHPTGGTTTTVIARNPRVSGKSLMLAAGLGSGAMVTMLGTAVLLYAVTQKYCGPKKTGPDSDTSQQKKKLSIASCPDKKQLQ